MTELNEKYLITHLKKRIPESHKGTYGTLCAVVGSENYRGAAVLSCGGALRSGVGIMKLCSAETVCAAVAASFPSATFCPLPKTDDGMISASAIQTLNKCLPNASALLIGCGLGQSQDTAELVKHLVTSFQGRTVLDADALNLLSSANSTDILDLNTANNVTNKVITPHIGEMSRLCGKSIAAIKASPELCAVEFSLKYNCVTVLKDFYTVIAAPNVEKKCNTYISRLGNAGLAKGGSGDVLAGIIGGLLAQGYTAEESATIGVTLHGLSADLCASENSMQAMLPSDLDRYICKVLAKAGY